MAHKMCADLNFILGIQNEHLWTEQSIQAPMFKHCSIQMVAQTLGKICRYLQILGTDIERYLVGFVEMPKQVRCVTKVNLTCVGTSENPTTVSLGTEGQWGWEDAYIGINKSAAGLGPLSQSLGLKNSCVDRHSGWSLSSGTLQGRRFQNSGWSLNLSPEYLHSNFIPAAEIP